MYKLGAAAYGTGSLCTFLYVNNRLRRQIRNPNTQSNFLILYSSLAHGTYWPLYWTYRHFYSTQFLKPNVPTPESGTIRNQDEQRRVRLQHENNVQSGAPAPLPHHDFPAEESGGPSQYEFQQTT